MSKSKNHKALCLLAKRLMENDPDANSIEGKKLTLIITEIQAIEAMWEKLSLLRRPDTLCPKIYSFTEVKEIVTYFDKELLVADKRWKVAEAEIAKHKDEFGDWVNVE